MYVFHCWRCSVGLFDSFLIFVSVMRNYAKHKNCTGRQTKTNHTQHHRQHKPSQDVTPQKWCTSRAFDSQTKTKELLEQNRRSCMNETKKLCPEITTEALDNSEPTDDAILQHHTKRKSERHHRLGNVRQHCNEQQTTKRNKQ